MPFSVPSDKPTKSLLKFESYSHIIAAFSHLSSVRIQSAFDMCMYSTYKNILFANFKIRLFIYEIIMNDFFWQNKGRNKGKLYEK